MEEMRDEGSDGFDRLANEKKGGTVEEEKNIEDEKQHCREGTHWGKGDEAIRGLINPSGQCFYLYFSMGESITLNDMTSSGT